MKISKNPLNLLELVHLLNSTNKISAPKNLEPYKLEKFCKELKLKLLHSKNIANSKNNYNHRELITIIKNNNSVDSNLKMLYLINYKEKFDQYQTKRASINQFNSLSLKKSNSKKYRAYKNTENINALYELQKLQYYSD
jgi:hypothetical protein